jgi:uncharacterized membrane protein
VAPASPSGGGPATLPNVPLLRRSIPPFDRRWLVRHAPVAALALLILAIAAALRLPCLGCQSLWLDEILTAEATRQPTIGGALALAASWIDQAPLPYVLTWALRDLGPGEVAIRLPYAIAGVVAAVATFVLVTSLFGRLAGLIAGILMAVFPYAIYYSQESRSYILLILLTTVLMHAAYRAANRQRGVDWALLVVVGSLSLYVGYLAAATLAAAYSYIFVVLLLDWVGGARETGHPLSLRTIARPIAGVTIAGGATVVSFLPWLSNFVTFLGRRDLGFGRVSGGQAATPGTAFGVMAQLDLHGISLALFVAGIVTAIAILATGRWRTALLPLAFLFVPLGGFFVLAGGGIVQIWPRYFSILYQPIVMLVALGIVGLSETFVLVVRRVRGSATGTRGPLIARLMVVAPLVFLVGAPAVGAAQAAQHQPKGSDYRGAVDRILAADPIRPVVVVTGPNAAWVERGLVYYGWARASGLRIIDGLDIDLASTTDVRAATSLWLATRRMDMSSAEVPAGATRSGHADFVLFDIAIADGGGLAAARDMLASIAESEPDLVRATRLIDALDGARAPGAELLPGPTIFGQESGPPALERWTLQPGVTVAPGGSGFVASPAGGEVNAILATGRLAPGADFLLQFACRTEKLRGELRVWIIATDAAGGKVYLDGSGELCATAPGLGHSAIAFTVPEGAHVVTIWLQTIGLGDAAIGPISLRQLG